MTFGAGWEALRMDATQVAKDASKLCAASASVTTAGEANWLPKSLHPASVPAVIMGPAPAGTSAGGAASGGPGAKKGTGSGSGTSGAAAGGGKAGAGKGGGKGGPAASSAGCTGKGGGKAPAPAPAPTLVAVGGGLPAALVVQVQGDDVDALADMLTKPVAEGGYGLPRQCVHIAVDEPAAGAGGGGAGAKGKGKR